jgi:hypothetical protein
MENKGTNEAKDTQSRKYQLTINNPLQHELSHDQIKTALANFPALVYYCMADEQGETFHTHVYIAFSSSVRFSTMKRYFATAHIENAHGTSQENRDYILKNGKWENSEKHGTAIDGTFEEWGELPSEHQGVSDVFAQILTMIDGDFSLEDIRKQYPSQFFLYADKIKRLQQEHLQDIQPIMRPMEVTYIFGEPNTGKSYYVHNTFGKSLYTAFAYDKHLFDGYKGQNVLCIDKFNSQIPIEKMNTLLDVYPLELPARYSNKTALYEKVIIISNLNLNEQYRDVQATNPVLWQAFIRRIHKVAHFNADRSHVTYNAADYLANRENAIPIDNLALDTLAQTCYTNSVTSGEQVTTKKEV